MAVFKSQAIYEAARARQVYDGLLHTVQRSILIPSGTTLANGDIIRMLRIQPNKVVPTRVLVDVSGNLDGHATLGSRTLTATMGYLRSSDRNGTNLSVNAAGSAATESAAILLAAATTPIVAGSVASVTNFGGASGVGQMASGGFAVYNNLAGSLDPRGYDANVMDVAISITANSSTATTADITVQLTLEFAGVSSDPNSIPPYLYRDRYSTAGVSSL